ncbi:hypothetical protein AC482_04835 [miscellaneous Crenarchaeota group-15 archaeon DG-45]|uniref:Arginine deiminase n=1 Tax=miscellaneous Crenarchaeota group-15 archaeon DG-45 TaxID=1685127 RepID=A0A0M0BND4_9ARCH|nr:MAG: hypothetical protein AC482_04835 [miscellaneous Crenarchaeota group-15 archaeon DG-45]
MDMWTVKSEAGRLWSVMVHSAVSAQWWKIPLPGTHPLAAFRTIKQTYPIEEAAAEHGKIIEFLEEEGVRVFELNRVLAEILEGASRAEKEEIIGEVWGEDGRRPAAEELRVEHLIDGYPPHPIYDEESGELIVSGRQRGSIYSRDIAFMTQRGLVVSRMKAEGRREQPRIAKTAFERHPKLKENVDIILDANQQEEEIDLSPIAIEGGDVLILDEETILCGVGQRSNLLGLKYVAERIFEEDRDGDIRTICATRIAGPLPSGGHLDVFLNFPDRRKALVMPYILESDLVPGFPRRSLLTKMSDALVSLSDIKKGVGGGLEYPNFENCGMCDIYRRDGRGRPEKVSRERNLIDLLIREDKIDVDGIIMVGGAPEKENDVNHLARALQEGLREAGNIVTIKPGLIVAYERNIATNESLEEHGIRLKRLPSAHLDMLGGPHCMTMPLHRDPA